LNPDLYRDNSPDRFWRLLAEPEPGPEVWAEAITRAAAALPPEAVAQGTVVESILAQTLGEGQFGPRHWQLGHATRVYNALKPILPRSLTRRLKRAYGKHRSGTRLEWPVESRYVRFQFDVLRHVLELSGCSRLAYIDLWPSGHQYAFVLTHDIETAEGQQHVRQVADLESAFGFRSAFNFVPERYPVDRRLMDELRIRGFEIGVHGLKHDGRDFSSRSNFLRRAKRMNHYVKEFGAVGFRAPLTHRNPVWMQALQIEYDGSFFDTDPYEPIAGGTMSIWPYQLGRFVELPYTLTQDSTMVVRDETTPQLWLKKVDFVRANHGMALLNTHPDYLMNPRMWSIYAEFLRVMSERAGYYHALPCSIARWWRARARAASLQELPEGTAAEVIREELANRDDRCASRTADARSSEVRIA
jgi:peptidoglycan/xylan/chitin deacetylase (PgdA/CDA1 family)